MQVKSLGYRTDLIFAAFDGEIVDRGSYLVVRTPTNPTFYWGNFLLFDAPPQPGDAERWPRLFEQEVGRPPEVLHQTFGWDITAGELGHAQSFLDRGFRLSRSLVLTAQQVHPPPNVAADVTVRPLHTDDEWAQAVANQVACREPEFAEATYRAFKRRQMQRYRAMAASGLAQIIHLESSEVENATQTPYSTAVEPVMGTGKMPVAPR